MSYPVESSINWVNPSYNIFNDIGVSYVTEDSSGVLFAASFSTENNYQIIGMLIPIPPESNSEYLYNGYQFYQVPTTSSCFIRGITIDNLENLYVSVGQTVIDSELSCIYKFDIKTKTIIGKISYNLNTSINSNNINTSPDIRCPWGLIYYKDNVIDSDKKYLYVACNISYIIIVIDTETMSVYNPAFFYQPTSTSEYVYDTIFIFNDPVNIAPTQIL